MSDFDVKPTIYVVEFKLDESDGPWSEAEKIEAFDKIETAIYNVGGEPTRYIEPKE